MEQDDEVAGEGNSYTTHFRGYDSRIGRWLSMDPVTFPYESAYALSFNSPLILKDPTGGTPEGDPKKHLIKDGETLSQIAVDYNTTVENLQKLNSIEDPHKIFAGDELTISNPVEEKLELPNPPENYNLYPNNGSLQFVSWLDVPIIFGEEIVVVYAGEESAPYVQAAVTVISALRGNPKRIIKSADDLIEAAGTFTKKKSGMISDKSVIGNADEIFEQITKEADIIRKSGAIELPDGTIIQRHISSSTGQVTIDIRKVGFKMNHKIRIDAK